MVPDFVPINTRMILEKGLTVFGSSRSGTEDFASTIELYEKDEDIVRYLESIVSNIVEIRTIKDMLDAFEADIKKKGGKTVMVWKK